MSEPRTGTTTNTAEEGSSVGIQAGWVTGSTVLVNSTLYQVAPDASPQEKYEIGVRYLENGVPDRARKHITDAITLRYDSGQVRFHWILAMLSKRSYRDLQPAERQQIADVIDLLPGYADDEWKSALEAICELLESLRSRTDSDGALKKLNEARPWLRDKIDRHLDLVLTGTMKDNRWGRIHQKAKLDQHQADRDNRVWAYFQPDPAKPRARDPEPVSISPRAWFITITSSVLLVSAAGKLIQSALALNRLLLTFACATALVASYAGAIYGLRWRYQVMRLRAKERQHTDAGRSRRPPAGGFAAEVDRAFAYYFAKYVPTGVDREEWLVSTAGIHRTLREEIVDIYREKQIKADKIRWLIRYLVADVRSRWSAGTLWDYRSRYRTALSTKLRFFSAVLVLAVSLDAIVTVVTPTKPIAMAYFAIALLSGRTAGMHWRHVITECWRFRDEKAESERAYAERVEEFERWSLKLKEARPSENEMEYWLYCDKTVLLGEALRRYQLAWRDVIAHAFLQVPADRYKRAKVPGGPWRYSRYDVRLFLLTQDGVREVAGELDFEHAQFQRQDRQNYSFQQVSSVGVTETTGYRYTLKLTLTNGPTRHIQITEPTVVEQEDDENPEDPEKLFRMNLETTGFAHTLHILEGIAAEGRNWINRDPYSKSAFHDAAR